MTFKPNEAEAWRSAKFQLSEVTQLGTYSWNSESGRN